MDELIQCPKCGKQTNKYSPSCEHCLEPLKQGAVEAPQSLDTKEKLAQTERSAEPGPFSFKKCPFCAEEIRSEAVKCRYCGESIKVPSKIKINYGLLLTALAALIGIVVAGLLIYAGLTNFSGIDFKVDKPGKKMGELSDELKSDSIKAGYVKNNITLSGIGTLDETDPLSGGISKYVCGTLKNSGDKLIIKLKITVYYLDKNGRCIAEGSAWPILGAKAKPDSLAPNSSRDFQVLITSVSPEWSRRIKAKISDIELLD